MVTRTMRIIPYEAATPDHQHLTKQSVCLLFLLSANTIKNRKSVTMQSTALVWTAVKRKKFAKNKKNTSKERLSFSLFKV